MTEEDARRTECEIASSDICIGAFNVLEHVQDVVLPAIFGNYAATRAMLVATKVALGEDFKAELDTANGNLNFTFDFYDVETEAPETKLQIHSLMYVLFAYSQYGLVNCDTIQEALDHFGSYGVIEPKSQLGAKPLLIYRFVHLASGLFGPDNPIFPNTTGHNMEAEIRAARARLKIDTGSDGDLIDPNDLAALVKIKLKSIQNEMASGRALHSKKSGGIPVSVVKPWLKSRSSYLWSILDEDEADDHSASKQMFSDKIQDVVFLPTDKNGACFSPDHKRNEYFFVGERGSEEKFNDYLEALECLQKMKNPAWRKPSAKGHWITTYGVDWVRKSKSEIGHTSHENIDGENK